MARSFTCSAGHEWTGDETSALAVACPVCGAAPRPEHPSSSVETGVYRSQGADEAASSAESTVAYRGKQGQRVAAQPPDLPGYEIHTVLGRGGMGIVYRARQTALKRDVALKMILADGQAGVQELARFKTEAEAVARLQHPHIVQIHEIGEHEGRPYFTLEYVDGGSLAGKLAGTPLPPREGAALVETLARAVQSAHERGIIHRDLKPANVLLTANGQPKIADFGLAKHVGDDSGQTHTGQVMGTPSFMAPEQAAGDIHSIGPATDVYALGAILYECLTGRPPFKAATLLDTLQQVRNQDPVPPRQLQPTVPRDLETVCLKCLHKDPGKRYPSAEALAGDLGRFRAGEPIKARPTPAWERVWKWARRRPAAAAFLATGLVALVALGVLSLRLRDEAARTRAALAQSQRLAADLGLDRSLNICARGDPNQGLLWLARDLENLPEGCPDLEHAIRINLGAWQHAFSPLATPLPHDGPVAAVAFSADSRVAATGSEDGTAGLWQVADGRRIAVLRHNGSVRSLAFSPDGATLLTASDDGLARLWQVAGASLLAELRHGGPVRALAYHPTRPLVATASDDGTARLWALPGGTSVGEPFRHEGGVAVVAFRSDGQTLLTAGADRQARLWDLQTGKLVGKPLNHDGPVTLAAYSPDGEYLATVEREAGIPRVWDAFTGVARPPFNLSGYKPGPIRALAWSADGTRLATANDTWNTLVYDMASGRALHALGQQAAVVAVAFGPNGQVLTGSVDATAQRWGDTGERLGPPLRHQGTVQAVALSRDGTFALTGGADRLARLWRLPAAEWTVARINPPTSGVAMYRAAFRPDGSALAVGSDDGSLRFFDAAGQPVGVAQTPGAAVSALAFRPDGIGLAVATFANKLYLGDEAGFGAPIDLPGHVGGFTYSPDGGTLAIPVNSEVRFHDAATGQRIGAPLGHPAMLAGALVYHPNGRWLATACADRAVRIWDLETNAARGALLRHPGNLTYIALSPDGRLLATASEDKTVRLWEVATGKPVGRPLQHLGAVHTVAFSPDGRLLAASGREGYTHLWDTATGKPVGPPLPGAGFVEESLFHPSGRTVAVVHHNQIRIYPLPPPVEGPAEQLKVWAEVRTGLELTADGATRALDAPEWRQRREQLGEANPVKEIRLLGSAKPGAELLRLLGNREHVRTAAVSPDGRFALTAGGGPWDPVTKQNVRGADFSVRRLDLACGAVVGRFDGHTDWVMGLAMAPDGRHFASASRDKTVRLWDMDTGREVRRLDARAAVIAVAFLPDGRLVTTGAFGLIALWDPSTGNQLRSYGEGGTIAVFGLAVSSDGRQLLTGHQDGKVRLWDVASGTEVWCFNGHAGNAMGVAFVPGSARAVSAGFDKTLCLWDLELGKELRRYQGHTDRLSSVAVSPDGQYALSGGYDHTARLWEIASGRELAIFAGHRSGVASVAFLPGGRCLTADRNRALCVWRLPTGNGPSTSTLPASN